MQNQLCRFAAVAGLCLFTAQSMVAAQAAPVKRKAPPGLGLGAIHHAEQALGKKLTATQKAQIIKAAKEREKNIAMAHEMNWKTFRTRVAKITGVSLAQMVAKEKAVRAKKRR